MSRSVRRWRKVCPQQARQSQQVAIQSSSLFLVRQIGPTAFIIEEEGMEDNAKVTLGDIHMCNCRKYLATRELCVHICWVLLKKLRLKTTDPASFQIGLEPRVLEYYLHQRHERRLEANNASAKPWPPRGTPMPVKKRMVRDEDSCPICLEEFSSRRAPLVFCKYSCGNGLHARCMTVLSRHQTGDKNTSAKGNERENAMLRCPICRGEFCTPRELRDAATRAYILSGQRVSHNQAAQPAVLPQHPQSACRLCLKGPPIYGNLYKCLSCPQVIVCAVCLKSNNFKMLHSSHKIAIKKTPSDRWTPVVNSTNEPVRINSRTVLPSLSRKKPKASQSSGRKSRLRLNSDYEEVCELLRVQGLKTTLKKTLVEPST